MDTDALTVESPFVQDVHRNVHQASLDHETEESAIVSGNNNEKCESNDLAGNSAPEEVARYEFYPNACIVLQGLTSIHIREKPSLLVSKRTCFFACMSRN